MARGKKTEKVLTLEEKLEQALVPVEEQPYPVPENWCWVILGNFVRICRGASPRPIKSFITGDETGINWIKIGDADSSKYIVHTKEKVSETGAKKSVFVSKGTLLLSNSMSFGRPYILNIEGCIHDGWLAITPSEIFTKEYLYYALMASEWYFQQVAVGTAVRNLNSERVAKTPVPLPPKEEQYRIVNYIENTFAKLDEAKEKVQGVVDSFEIRKATILHKLFAGKLTERWRKENNIPLDSWCWKTIDEVCFDIKVGIVIKPSQYYTDNTHGTPAFRSANVRENHVDNFDWVYLNDKGMKANHRSIVHTGDVLIVRSGNPGTACVVTEEFDGYNAIDILIAVPNPELVLPEYLCLFTNSPLGKKTIAEGKRGMALAHFNVKSYSKVDICLPMLDEQKEIIDLFQKLLLNEQEVKKTSETVLDQIETMKKSILARAFHGELGTNDLSEEGIAQLLENML